MIQGLKSTDRQRVIVDDYVVRGKETRAKCGTARKHVVCPNNTISVEQFMLERMEEGDFDMNEHILTRPKVNQHYRSAHNGPRVNDYGIPHDLIMEVDPGNLRTKGQKLEAIAPVVTRFGSRLRKDPLRPRFPAKKLFKEHIDLDVALGIRSKHKKQPRKRSVRLKDKTELVMAGGDKTLGKRKRVQDKKALHALQENIEILAHTIAQYKKDPKGMNMKKFLQEHTEIINHTMATMSKEAKGRDLTKELLEEHTELVHTAQAEYRIRRKQLQKVKLAEQKKRMNLGVGYNGRKKEAKGRDLDECFFDDQFVNRGIGAVEAERIIPRPHSLPIPHGVMKP